MLIIDKEALQNEILEVLEVKWRHEETKDEHASVAAVVETPKQDLEKAK